MTLQNPEQEIADIVRFLQHVFKNTGKTKAVIAVSGGIDSALSLTLVTKALGVENVYPILLPYGEQSVEDSKSICNFLQIPQQNRSEVNIKSSVDEILKQVQDDNQKVRTGNIMARVRMIFVYDLAKKLDGLVCGTENKSEKYLAYFTRFGDEASDIEPIQHLYKTQVRQLVEYLQLPKVFLTKAPSAGLWQGQSDEDELGFSYAQADEVLEQYIDQKKSANEITLVSESDQKIVQKVIDRVNSQHFKHEVPYTISSK